MAKSLADQLAGMGLVDKDKAKKAKAEKRKQEKQQRKHKTEQTDEAKLAAEQAMKEKVERDRQLNKERQAQAEQKALMAQVKQIVDTTKITSPDGEIKYNFVDNTDNKIKGIYVTEAIQDDLASGRLAIASVENQYFVITKQVAEKIRERSESSVVFQADTTSQQVDEDDPYKDFVIPDDLMW